MIVIAFHAAPPSDDEEFFCSFTEEESCHIAEHDLEQLNAQMREYNLTHEPVDLEEFEKDWNAQMDIATKLGIEMHNPFFED